MLLETLFFSQSTIIRVYNLLIAFFAGLSCSWSLLNAVLIIPFQQSMLITLINSKRPD